MQWCQGRFLNWLFKLSNYALPTKSILIPSKDAVLNAASSLSDTAKIALQVAADKACGTYTASKGTASQVAGSNGAASGAHQDIVWLQQLILLKY